MKVTTKGQVTIPAPIREYLGISPHTEVDFRISNGAVVLLKQEEAADGASKFHKLRGALKGRLSTHKWMRETRGV